MGWPQSRQLAPWVLVRAVLVLAASLAGAASRPPSSAAAEAQHDLRAVLEMAPDLGRGAQLFSICAGCHGAHGEGYVSGWPPAIAGQHPRVIAKELVDFRFGLRSYDPMERIAGRHVLHTTADIASVAAYVGNLAPSLAAAAEPGESIDRGGRLYVRRCESCHGAGGGGSDARFVPRVAIQHFEYLLRQLQDTVAGRRPNMEQPHQSLTEDLTAEDLVGLAGYMSRLGRKRR
jgi:cytochrome c553